MFGIFYLILCVLTGMEMAGCLFPQQITEKGNRIWVILPAAFGTGVLMLTWAVYVVSWMFSVCAGAEHPLFYGNIIVMSVTVLCLLGISIRKRKRTEKNRQGCPESISGTGTCKRRWHDDGWRKC